MVHHSTMWYLVPFEYPLPGAAQVLWRYLVPFTLCLHLGHQAPQVLWQYLVWPKNAAADEIRWITPLLSTPSSLLHYTTLHYRVDKSA